MRSGFTNFNANIPLIKDRIEKSILTCDEDMNCKLKDNVSRFAANTTKNIAKEGYKMAGVSDKVANAIVDNAWNQAAAGFKARKAISNKNSM